MSVSDENDGSWYPVNYNPGFTVEDWIMLLRDKSIFSPSSLEVIKSIKECGGITTCVELSVKYGKKPNFYNTNAWQLGKRIYTKTGCPLCQEKDYKYWPILFWGRHAKSKKIGTYEWKLRDELSMALDIFELEEQTKFVQKIPSSLLEEKAEQHSSKSPTLTKATIQRIYRSPYISEYAKRRANGFCQLCCQKAPFCDSSGRPYLESHHIIWLSQGGEDSVSNVVALCPNCHRKMHIVQDENDVKILQKRINELLQPK